MGANVAAGQSAHQLSGAQILARLLALGAGALAFPDNVFSIVGSSDATKIAAFEVDGFTTGTTRTFTLPNASITVAGINLAQTFSATQTFAAIDATSIGATTRGTGAFTTLAANAAVTFTLGTGTGLAISSTTAGATGSVGSLTTQGGIYAAQASFFGGQLVVERSASTNNFGTGQVTGEAQARLTMRVDGLFGWGDGTAARDTCIARNDRPGASDREHVRRCACRRHVRRLIERWTHPGVRQLACDRRRLGHLRQRHGRERAASHPELRDGQRRDHLQDERRSRYGPHDQQ